MKYNADKLFKPRTKKGGLRKAPYFGPMVLLDYISPKFARSFRALKAAENTAWHEMSQRMPRPKTPWTSEMDEEDKRREANRDRAAKCIRLKYRHFFQILCESAHKKYRKVK